MGEVQRHNLEFWCQKVFNDPEMLAEDVYGNKIPLDANPKPKPFRTYCNIAIQRVSNGCFNLDCFDGLMANDIYDYCLKNWQPCDVDTAVTYAGFGDIVIAAWKNPDPEKHGHVAIVLGKKPLMFSGKWARYVPWVASVDRVYPTSCNFAFAECPDFFRAGIVNS